MGWLLELAVLADERPGRLGGFEELVWWAEFAA